VNFLLNLCICPVFREGAGRVKTGYDVEGDIATVAIAWDRVPVLEFRVVIERNSSCAFGKLWRCPGYFAPIPGREAQKPGGGR
jgi:hypothetical protein